MSTALHTAIVSFVLHILSVSFVFMGLKSKDSSKKISMILVDKDTKGLSLLKT